MHPEDREKVLTIEFWLTVSVLFGVAFWSAVLFGLIKWIGLGWTTVGLVGLVVCALILGRR